MREIQEIQEMQQMQQMRDTWRISFNERQFKDIGIGEEGEFQDLTAEARSFWEQMEKGVKRNSLWTNLTTVVGTSMLTRNYVRLRHMAIALNTVGSELEGSEPLKADIVEALDWMLTNHFNAQAETNGNWWDWEIGAPMALTETLLLMSPYLSRSQIEAYLAPIDTFTPDPKTFLNSVSQYPTMTSTGANRVWICKVIALRSLLLEDSEKLASVCDALSTLFEYVTGGEGGFFADGSFTQHGYPYTGGYGKSLISSLVPLLHVLEGTSFEVKNRDRIYDWVYQSFEPLIFRGSLMDMVSGREVSRHDVQNHESGHSAIGAMLELSNFAPQPHANNIKQMVKYWIQEDKAKPFMAHTSLYLRRLSAELLQDDRIIAQAPASKYKMFANMARAVLQRPEFAFGIGLSSKRIATHESINGENLKGWYAGHGITSLYNSDLGHYSDGYWPTVDPYRLAGITVTNQPRENAFGNLYRSSESWAGGTELRGLYGSAGMVLEDYKSEVTQEPMRARKSWFLFENELVALGSDIQFAGPFQVETIVENRKLNMGGTNRFKVNGDQMPDQPGWASVMPNTKWMHMEGDAPGTDIGYYFPQAVDLQGKRETRTGRWSDVGTGPNTVISRNYLTVWFDHGVSPQNESYAYVILPGKSATETEGYANQPQVEIIQQTSAAHAVYHTGLGILGVNFWTEKKASAMFVTCTGKASVMVMTTDEVVEVAISDPTHENGGIIELEIDMAARTVIEADPRIEVVHVTPTVKLHFHAQDTHGSRQKSD